MNPTTTGFRHTSPPAIPGLFGLLDSAAQCHPTGTFLIDSHREFSYQDVHRSARALAAWWKSQGIGRGHRIAICCQNRAEIAVAVFASALVGAIFVVLNPGLRPHGMAKILQQADPASVLADDSTASLFADLPLPEAKVFAGAGAAPHGWTPWDAAQESAPLDPGSWPGIDVDPVSLVFTSGSTAEPRGVTLSHDNILFVTAAIQERLRYRPDDVIGGFLPMAFDYGLYQIFLAARAGATFLIGDPSQVGPRLPKILADAKVSVLPAVPTVYAALISLFHRRPFSLPILRAITNTGERLPLAYIDRLEAMFPGLEVFPMYGLTECKRVSILRPHERKLRPSSVGRALPGTEVFAVDENGDRLPPGENGELVVRGRHIAHGYWKAPEETARRFRKRAPEAPVELFTGDRGSVDAEGFIFFSSRADDLLKHRGNRISPFEIEMESCALPGVVESALVKRVADDSLHLFVSLSDPALTGQDIIRQLAGILEPFKVPDFVHISPSLPKSLNSKVDRKLLLQHIDEPSTNHHEPILETSGR